MQNSVQKIRVSDSASSTELSNVEAQMILQNEEKQLSNLIIVQSTVPEIREWLNGIWKKLWVKALAFAAAVQLLFGQSAGELVFSAYSYFTPADNFSKYIECINSIDPNLLEACKYFLG